MQAAVFRETGEPAEVLSVAEVDLPQPAAGEVRVRMLLSPINPSDLLFVRGVYGSAPQFPAVPGFEGVGIVEAAGPGLLGRFLVGKRVAALNRASGNWSERTVLPAKQAVPLSSKLSDEQAATFFVNPATALVMTREVLKVPAGAWLLQSAAGSSLGRMVVRLGKKYGFRTVNVVRRAEQADELRALGADVVLPFDPAVQTVDELRESIAAATGKSRVTYALDPVGGATGSAIVACLGRAGRLISFGTLSDEPLSFSPRELIGGNATVSGFWLANWMEACSLPRKLKLVKQLTKLIAEGVLDTQVGQVFPLEKVSEAVQAAEQSGRAGKVLLRIGE